METPASQGFVRFVAPSPRYRAPSPPRSGGKGLMLASGTADVARLTEDVSQAVPPREAVDPARSLSS